MTDRLSDDPFAHVRATLWGTNARLQLTHLQSPLLPVGGIDAAQLIGSSVQRLLESDGMGMVIAAHERALRGVEAPFDVAWGAQRFLGWVSPVRQPDGSVVGTRGVAIEATPEATDAIAAVEGDEVPDAVVLDEPALAPPAIAIAEDRTVAVRVRIGEVPATDDTAASRLPHRADAAMPVPRAPRRSRPASALLAVLLLPLPFFVSACFPPP